jgi:hypothetical protein
MLLMIFIVLSGLLAVGTFIATIYESFACRNIAWSFVWYSFLFGCLFLLELRIFL